MRSNRHQTDVLWLVEHIAREMDVACVAKALMESRYGLTVSIKNIYYHAKEILNNSVPRVVVHPFFYFLKGALATEDYVAAWPNATHFNLAWEQIHYKAHLKIKAPADDFTQKQVIHHAWGDFYKDYLISSSVDVQNVFVNGQPAYQLYKAPYRNHFKTREQLAGVYGLNPNDRWIFIPENYRWAFIGSKIKQFKGLGGDEREIKQLSEFCTHSLRQLLAWCNRVGSQDGVSIIFRPRPAVNSRIMEDFCQKNVGGAVPKLYFIKNESVREWIMASDVVMSSYSTSLIEAAVAEKPIYMIEPLPFPDCLYCNWYDYASRIVTMNDFEKACLNSDPAAANDNLKSWAENTLLAYGDPIERLAIFIRQLVERHKLSRRFGIKPNEIDGLGEKKYFNPITHENDVFEDKDIEQRTEAWMRTMGLEMSGNNGKQMTETAENSVDTINKTMSRADLLSPEAVPVVKDLDALITKLSQKNLCMSSWVGTLPSREPEKQGFFMRLRRAISRLPHRSSFTLADTQEGKALERGLEQRLDYTPLANSANDVRFPWFLYWEIFWVLKVTRPFLKPGSRILDGGGSASLFTCYMSSLGYEVHCVELNQKLNAQSRTIAEAMKYKLFPYDMDLRKLDFPNNYFDHAFSICVFEHLDYDIKQAALVEIARCLKPGGIFSITFDYRNPAPGIVGYGKDIRPKNRLQTEDDIRRSFLSSGHFELMGNQKFIDTGESYLLHQRFGNTPYTFGAIFLQKKSSDK